MAGTAHQTGYTNDAFRRQREVTAAYLSSPPSIQALENKLQERVRVLQHDRGESTTCVHF